MKYASVCDGIGAVHAAWQPLGWECAWTSEIDPFPSAVVEQRWGFENRGDMTRYKEWPDDDGTSIDLLVGGTPCQSFSVAGLRKGLSDPRGGLMLTYLEIARRYRPRWIVWENVPGVLSSNGGRDFGSFVGALGDVGYGWAYRVLDAQWFGVAQRRRRVFVVGCFGDAASAAKVLFESEGVRRNPAPSRQKGQGVTYDVAPCIGASGRGFERAGDTRGQDPVVAVQDTCGTLCADHHPGAYSGQDAYTGRLIAQPQAFYSTESRCDGIPAAGLSPPLKVGSNGGEQPPAVAFAQKQTSYVAFTAKGSGADAGAICPTIRAGGHSKSHANGGVMPAVAHTLKGRGFDGSEDGTGRGTPLVPLAMAVRRLTPRECERLQGFPDDYTAIEYRKKPAADGPRYKALGNSMAVSVMRWIGERIEAVQRGSGG